MMGLVDGVLDPRFCTEDGCKNEALAYFMGRPKCSDHIHKALTERRKNATKNTDDK